MNTVTVNASRIDTLKRRVIKFLRFGKSDVQESIEVAPFGIDNAPIKNLIALYAQTTENGKSYIVGYLNKNQKSEPGENRSYATDDAGAEVFYIWQRKDGTVEIGGTDNYAVKFNELKAEFNALKSDYNNLVTTFNGHTHILALTAGTGTAAVSVTQGQTNTSNIDNAKNDKIKTI